MCKAQGGIKVIYISCMVMVCSIIIVLIYRHHTVKTFEHLNHMIDHVLENTFEEEVFDESRCSALESKLAHYLLASQVSSRNVMQEREKIKGLITDISHQTKTPISNILLYSEMLIEDSQTNEDRQNLEALHQQAEKLNFLIASLVKLSRLESGIIIETLGLSSKLANLPNNLSGGQQQRVAIARALAAKPAIILADEPTGNLDSRTSQDVMGLLKITSQKYTQTIVMITHNEEIAQLADRIIRIEDGHIVTSQNGGRIS